MKKRMILGVMAVLLCVTAGCHSKNEESPQEISGEDTLSEEIEESEETNEAALGAFMTQDIYGETVTQDIFADYDLTLVNLFATWCGPCISEMPELAQLQKDLQAEGVNIVAVVLDSVEGSQINAEAVDVAQQIAELTQAEFTFMIPDETNMNGRLNGISAVPESFFVDRDGNIVGETYVGARDYDTWMAIIQEELANVRGTES